MCCRHDSDAHNRGPLWSLGTQVVADLPEAVAPYDGPRRKSPFGYVTQRREERPHAPVQDRPTRLQRANKHQYFLGVGRSPRPTYFRPLVDALACVADLEAVAPGLCGAGHMERRWRFRLPSQQCREGSLISGRRAVIFSTDGVHSGDRGRGALTGSTAASPEATREAKTHKGQRAYGRSQPPRLTGRTSGPERLVRHVLLLAVVTEPPLRPDYGCDSRGAHLLRERAPRYVRTLLLPVRRASNPWERGRHGLRGEVVAPAGTRDLSARGSDVSYASTCYPSKRGRRIVSQSRYGFLTWMPSQASKPAIRSCPVDVAVRPPGPVS